MKPEIKAMLPELPLPCEPGRDRMYYNIDDIQAWLEKLTEGANVVHMDKNNYSIQTALLICPREIKKQTPLEIAVEALKRILDVNDDRSVGWRIARDTLAKIEASK